MGITTNNRGIQWDVKDLVAGNDWGPYPLTIRGAGQPIDLTGCTLVGQVLHGDLVAANINVEVTDVAQGQVSLSMLPAATGALTAKQYDWGLTLVDSLGRRTELVRGTIAVSKGVPRHGG